MASKRQQNLAGMSTDQVENLILHEPGLGRGWKARFPFENARKYMGFSNEEKAVFMSWDDDLRDHYLKNIVQIYTPRKYDEILNQEAEQLVDEIKQVPELKKAVTFDYDPSHLESFKMLERAQRYRDGEDSFEIPASIIKARLGITAEQMAGVLERLAEKYQKAGRGKTCKKCGGYK